MRKIVEHHDVHSLRGVEASRLLEPRLVCNRRSKFGGLKKGALITSARWITFHLPTVIQQAPYDQLCAKPGVHAA